jgi:integrase
MSIKDLHVLRDRKADPPAAANNRVESIRSSSSGRWRMSTLPRTRHAAAGDGHHSRTVEEVAACEARHEVGTRARLAMALMLWTACRRFDVVLLGRRHTRAGWLKFAQQKNRNKKPVTIEVPLPPELARVTEASLCGDMTFLLSAARGLRR